MTTKPRIMTNKPNINKKSLRGAVGLWAIAALAGTLLATTAGVASADYGQGAVYQIALSATLQGGTQGGAGTWLWIALYSGGTGDYAGADCAGGLNGHVLKVLGLSPIGAAADDGGVTWSTYTGTITNPCTGKPVYSGTLIRISGVKLMGLGGYPTTITVPAADGHYYAQGINTYMTLPPLPVDPCGGFSQLAVAP
jgi:hypothetical protein